MAKIDKTVFTAQIEAVNTILQLCYTLRDYVNSLIDQGNASIDDIATINAQLLLINNEISQITSDVVNNANNITSLTNAITSINESITSLNNTLTTKLDKVTNATEVMQTYVKQPNGNQQMVYVHWDNVRDTIPIRDQTGNIRVANTPTVPSHATSKKYVDDTKTQTLNDVDNKLNEYTGVIVHNIEFNYTDSNTPTCKITMSLLIGEEHPYESIDNVPFNGNDNVKGASFIKTPAIIYRAGYGPINQFYKITTFSGNYYSIDGTTHGTITDFKDTMNWDQVYFPEEEQ